MLRSIPSVIQLQGAEVERDAEVVRVIEALHPRLYRYARFRLERGEAEDATSAALERMWRVRSSYRPDRGALQSWLQTVGYNAIRDEVRRVYRRPRTIQVDDLQLVDHSANVELAALMADLRRALANLSEVDAEIIGHRYGLGLSNEETGALLGRSTGAVATATHGALHRLREEMNR